MQLAVLASIISSTYKLVAQCGPSKTVSGDPPKEISSFRAIFRRKWQGTYMTLIKQSFEDLPGKKWKIFGEAEFPTGTSIDDLVHAWLVDTLRPLNLNARFLDKILASAHLAIERNIQYTDGQDSDHVHILICTPVDIPACGQFWGFFRVEKRGDPPAEKNNLDHAIAFYLYFEGK